MSNFIYMINQEKIYNNNILALINVLSQIDNCLNINIYSTCKDLYLLNTKCWKLNNIKSYEFIINDSFREYIYNKLVNSHVQLNIMYTNTHIECNNVEYMNELIDIYDDFKLLNLRDINLHNIFKYIYERYFTNNYIIIDFDLYELNLNYTYCSIGKIRLTSCNIYNSYIDNIDINSRIDFIVLIACILLDQYIINDNIKSCNIRDSNIIKYQCNNCINIIFDSCYYLESIECMNAKNIYITNCMNINKINISDNITTMIIQSTFDIFRTGVLNINNYNSLLYLKIVNDDFIEEIKLRSLKECHLYECANIKSISDCDNLEILDIRVNTKISSICNLKKIHTITLVDTYVNDIFLDSLKVAHIELCDFVERLSSKNVKNITTLTIKQSSNINKITGNNLNYLKIINNIKCNKLHIPNLVTLELKNTNVKNILVPKLECCKLENIKMPVLNNDSISKLYIKDTNIEKILCKNVKELYICNCNNIINIKLNKLLKLSIEKSKNIRFLDCKMLEMIKIDKYSNNDELLLYSNIPNIIKILYL